MVYVLVRHKVKDYSSWKPGFDEHGSVRKESGSKGGMLFSTLEDSNDLFILLEFDNIENARSFIGSNELKKKMEEVGVVGKPDIFFLNKLKDVPV